MIYLVLYRCNMLKIIHIMTPQLEEVDSQRRHILHSPGCSVLHSSTRLVSIRGLCPKKNSEPNPGSVSSYEVLNFRQMEKTFHFSIANMLMFIYYHFVDIPSCVALHCMIIDLMNKLAATRAMHRCETLHSFLLGI